MFCAGWVHRDVSTGNVLARRLNGLWHVQLADFEYAKRYSYVASQLLSDPKIVSFISTSRTFLMIDYIGDELLYGA